MGIRDLGGMLVVGFLHYLGIALVTVYYEVSDRAVIGLLGAVAVDVVLEVDIGHRTAGLVLHRADQFVSRIVTKVSVITIDGLTQGIAVVIVTVGRGNTILGAAEQAVVHVIAIGRQHAVFISRVAIAHRIVIIAVDYGTQDSVVDGLTG